MVSVDEALRLVLQAKRDFGTEEVSLLQSTARVLAMDVFADRDFPPFNRVMMDGVAINSQTFSCGKREFTIEKIQPAGSPQQTLEDVNNCIEVMTGAVLPANTDIVIPYEQCEIAKNVATVKSESAAVMQNVHLQASDCKKDSKLVNKFETITPAIIGLMASVGLSGVEVLRLPKVCICSTGDELVNITDQPKAHQIRRSNVYMLAAALLTEGIVADATHLPDEPVQMKEQIAILMKTNDVILFSGAVSKGKFDYLPKVLEQLGMEQTFHTVAQRPGKPFLFGKFANQTLVFGFPGNPVSTFVCFHQFFKQWILACLKKNPQQRFATLAADVTFTPSLSYHLLVEVSSKKGELFATKLSNSGSGDLVTLTKANGIITFPAEKDVFKAGEVFEINLL